MATRIFLLFIVGLVVFTPACEKPADVAGCFFPEDIEAGYELVWSDEFDGDEIDTTKWSFDIGDGCDRGICGWGNNELQYYTDRPENAFVTNGNLIIRARREQPAYEGYEYTSARMVTRNKGDWTYGRMDVRARMPIGQGLWPAAWMLPTDTVYGQWPRSGEIDIMEYLGSEPSKVFGTLHYGLRFPDQYEFIGDNYFLPEGETFNQDFHVFTALWNEDCIQFLMDGELYSGPYSRSTLLPYPWPFDQRFHMILNIAVGGNLPGNPDASTQFPQVMQVDYVRVYREKE
jgi:beta-glucanase (GH16 family)